MQYIEYTSIQKWDVSVDKLLTDCLVCITDRNQTARQLSVKCRVILEQRPAGRGAKLYSLLVAASLLLSVRGIRCGERDRPIVPQPGIVCYVSAVSIARDGSIASIVHFVLCIH